MKAWSGIIGARVDGVNRCRRTGIMRDLAAWPAIAAYCARIKQDLSVARAMTDENALFAAKQQRNK